jgi:putative thioredoxin
LTAVTIDVTDATFPTDVLERSTTTPVVVDLWAEWCGPCKTLGPILEQVIAETDGQVVLAKVDVDQNPQTAQAFRVQSIPAVYAVAGGKVVDGFVGAQPEEAVREFVARLLPTREQTEVERLRELGDEASLRKALELEPDDEGAIVDLAELLVGEDRGDEALELLARIPETADTRRVAALARSGGGFASEDDIERRLGELLDDVKEDAAARQEFLDLLEILGPDDPRTGAFRRQLTSRLF